MISGLLFLYMIVVWVWTVARTAINRDYYPTPWEGLAIVGMVPALILIICIR